MEHYGLDKVRHLLEGQEIKAVSCHEGKLGTWHHEIIKIEMKDGSVIVFSPDYEGSMEVGIEN